LDYVYTFLTQEDQSSGDVVEAAVIEIEKVLDLLVDNIDLKAKDTADFFTLLRNFKTFAKSITEAVRELHWVHVFILLLCTHIDKSKRCGGDEKLDTAPNM